MSDLENKVDSLDKKVSEIYTAIMGSQFHEKGGYKPRLEDLECRVEAIEDMITKWKWILVGFIGLGGYGGLTFIQQMTEFIANSFKK